MHSIFCCLESWGLFNETPLRLFHVKSFSDSPEIVLILKESPTVIKHPIAQLNGLMDNFYLDERGGKKIRLCENKKQSGR